VSALRDAHDDRSHADEDDRQRPRQRLLPQYGRPENGRLDDRQLAENNPNGGDR